MFVTLVKSCAQTVLITGANEGIGYQTALALATKKYRVVMVDKNDMENSKNSIIEQTKNCNVETIQADFTSFDSVRCLVEEVKKQESKLNVLINNVGVFCLGKERTENGLIGTMQVNHLAPFLLTHKLAEQSAPSRVLFVSSLGSFFHNLTVENFNNPEICTFDGFSSLAIYYNSKLCNMIAANGFARKLRDRKIIVNCLHPGMTSTTFLWKNANFQNPFKYFLQDPEMGAQNSIFLATTNLDVSGKFFVQMREHQQPLITQNVEFCDHIWSASEYFAELKCEERL